MGEYKNILVITSVDKELKAVKKSVQKDQRFHVVKGGVGQAAAAAQTAKLLSNCTYDLVINIGIAGGVDHITPIGSIAVANKVIAADLGVETAEQFITIENLGLGTNSFEISEHLFTPITQILMNKNVNYCVGPLLTVSSATGTTLTKTKRLNLYPQAIAEAMEGFGVATAADLYQIPFIEIRTISNMVGQRRRDLWKIEEAIKNIEVVSRLLTEVL